MAGENGLESDQQVDMRLNSGPPVGPYAPGVTAPPPGPFVPGVSAPKYGPFVPGSPGGSANFASTPAEKKAAAGTIETELEPNTKKAAEHADDATNTAHKGFDGWETAAGLKKVADTWDQQVKTLMGRLAGEKGALRGASGLFARNDTGLHNQFVSQSKLNGL
ncbi:hypothetical protein MTF65_09900 [Streptomyces sp. APSN-46.1]|uniref:hypothetical protein n=1 Tax=Streptomyces sp. APSN-46.1 TaxID=2929049 RepID=UPI001FB219CA|nr:hypothetical protein [Streptomyces sp. APSN-46.1]MCJ1677644.1 hypothetical protein [Streptomyces sp. APSN-46.1]